MRFGQVVASSLRKLRNRPHAYSVSSFSEKPTTIVAGSTSCPTVNCHRKYSRRGQHEDTFQWILMSGPAAIVLGTDVTPALAEDSSVDISSDDRNGSEVPILRKVEDGSVISNIHTSKWRVFTDTGRDYFSQRKLEEAENFFLAALQEAKKGFGERDPHVASASNNLAELYRVKKDFEKAEPLYLEAINILEESLGSDDIRVGAALHNLGQFYRVCGKLQQARTCFERAVKIKKRVLGQGNPDYADTLYQLGTVLYFEGKEKDAEALISDSIRILEEAGLGESGTCLRRLQHLAQIYMKCNKLVEAEKIQRKILHVMELSKGWNSLETVIVAERLALNLTTIGNLVEADELFERCLHARKALLPEDHIENAANMLYTARVKNLKANQLRKTNIPRALVEFDNAKILFSHSIRIARKVLVQFEKQRQKQQTDGILRNEHSALLILLQSLNALAVLEQTKREMQEFSRDTNASPPEAENILRECISTYKEFGAKTAVSNSPEVKAEYLSCLRHLSTLLIDEPAVKKDNLEELKREIKRVEDELCSTRKS